MDQEEVYQISNEILNKLINSNIDFDNDLSNLSKVVKLTSAGDFKFNNSDIIDNILNYQIKDNKIIQELRLFRGLLLIVRNVAINLDLKYMNLCITSFQDFHQSNKDDSDLIIAIHQTYWEILANFKRIDENHFEIIPKINQLFETFSVFENKHFKPIIHFLFRQFSTPDIEITNENLLKVLKLKSNFILQTIHQIYKEIDFGSSIDHDFKLFIHLLYDIIAHESFGNWLIISKKPIVSDWLELTFSVIQTKDSWNSFELIPLISWNISIFLESSKQLESINDDEIENILVPNLDLLANISSYEIMTQYCHNDKLMEDQFIINLVKVLKFIHENVKSSTLKEKVEEIKYPSSKLNIIIILSYLCFEDFKIQEKIREIGGLNLILSNCQIDNNNPFIKEHSILCIKYLLDKNPKNQQFVADLEAKKTINDDVLDEIGYEVEIVDGKVGMKKKAGTELDLRMIKTDFAVSNLIFNETIDKIVAITNKFSIP